MGSSGPDPVEAVEAVTYDGERVVDVVGLAEGTVGVTTHRVVVLSPDAEGPRQQAAPLANVESIAESTGGEERHVRRAVRFGVYGLALLAGSLVVDFDGMAAVEPPTAAAGPDRLIGAAVAATSLLSAVDDALRLAGALVLVVALGFGAYAWRGRQRELRVAVSGDEPLVLALHRDESVDAGRLRAAVEKASNPTTG